MAWVWEAELDGGHATGGEVAGAAAFVTPVEPGEHLRCRRCGGDRVVVKTSGRGR